MVLHGHAAAWPDGWAMVKARLERVRTNHWETVSLSLERADFLRKFEKEIALVLDTFALRDLMVAIDNQATLPIPQLNVLLKSYLGKALFKKEALLAQWQRFTAEAAKLLQDLLHQDWAVEADQSFKKWMHMCTTTFVQNGHKGIDKQITTNSWLTFFGP